METVIEVRKRVSLECRHWFTRQIRNPNTDFFCYLVLADQGNRKQDTGILICKDKPQVNVKMVGRLRRDKTVPENVSMLMQSLAKMPCLDV